MELILISAIIIVTNFLSHAIGVRDGKKKKRSQRIKDYNAGYRLGRVKSDRTAEEYLNEEK